MFHQILEETSSIVPIELNPGFDADRDMVILDNGRTACGDVEYIVRCNYSLVVETQAEKLRRANMADINFRRYG